MFSPFLDILSVLLQSSKCSVVSIAFLDFSYPLATMSYPRLLEESRPPTSDDKPALWFKDLCKNHYEPTYGKGPIPLEEVAAHRQT